MRIMFGVVASGIDWFYEMPKGVITFPSMFLAAIASWLLWCRYRFHLGGTVLGLIGLELMILCLFLTYSSDNLWDVIPLLCLSVLICIAGIYSVACFVYTAWNSQMQRLVNALAALSITVAAVAWWFAGCPLASHLRVCRHYREIDEKLPALNALASHVECFRDAARRTPDESEFWQLESGLRKESDRLRSLYCVKDWGFVYRKISDQQFHLVYFSFDVDLMYDSELPTAGWVPARDEAGQYIPLTAAQ